MSLTCGQQETNDSQIGHFTQMILELYDLDIEVNGNRIARGKRRIQGRMQFVLLRL